jgi:hypothetical protein
MDTYRIYEQFKEPFGEPAARALAETLGSMFEELHNTVTKEDFRILRDSIDADVSRLDSALSGLAEAQGRTEANVAQLNTTIADLRLLDQIEPHLSHREVDDVLRADVIASGLVDGEQTHLVVEVSWTGDIDDVVRADERAKLLRRAGLPAIPLVACNAISPESTAFAKLREVRIWLDSSLVGASAN